MTIEVKQITSRPNERLTVIVPVYNEAACLNEFRRQMDGFLFRVPVDTKVLFVNDGSTDDSQSIIEQICATNNRYGFLAMEKNAGLSTAIKVGIDACDSTLIGYIDADCQTDPMDFITFLPFLPDYDLITGIRTKRNDRFIKTISSKIANSIRRVLIKDDIIDTCCPLKIIKSKYARKILFFKGMHRFLPALVQLEGGRIQQVPVQHFPRYAGVAKYHLKNRLMGPFIDTLAYMWMKKRYIRYDISKKAL